MIEIQNILTKTHNKGMILSATFKVTTNIDKLPSLGREFKSYLKYKHNEVNLKDLIIKFKAKEDNKASTKRGCIPIGPKANIVKYD